MKRLIAILLLVAVTVSLFGCTDPQNPNETTGATEATVNTETTEPTQSTDPQNTMTGEELMQEMKIGWNLGNTLDAPDGETSWGMPMTTREIIQAVKDMGFNTIRIPVSWHKHVSAAPEYTIDENWIKRVATLVDYALELDMYVIINSHHDNSIYMPTPENQQAGQEYLNAIWLQIAEYFKDYDHHLIFQTMNEPRVEGTSYEWYVDANNEDALAAVEVVNALNQTAVDAIRSTGGYNAQRWIVVSPYAANYFSSVISSFRLPEDPAGKLIVSLHSYSPYNLALNVNSDVNTFSKADYSDISGPMKSLYNKYVKNGIPVIIDEMGCLNKENDEARYEWAKYYVSTAKKYGMVCVWWDNGVTSTTTEGFGILNRRKLTVFDESVRVLQGLMEGLETEE